MNRRIVAVTVLIILLLSAFLTGCRGKTGAGGDEDKKPTVATVKATRGVISGVTVLGGKMEAPVSANVVSKLSGKVAEIPVDVGSPVAAGDLLVRLDAEEMAAAVQLAEANLQKARESDLPSLENQARTNLATAEATYKNAESEYQRSKALLDGGVISRQIFDQAEKAYLMAKSAYESAERNLEIIVTSTIPDTIRQAEAQLAQARANFANNIITAPISGVVTARNINPGELASNSQPVVSIVSLDKLVVRLDVGENMINTLSEGSEVDVKVSAASPNPFKGTVTNIALAANPVSKAYLVKIEIPNPDHVLKPGMFAEATLKGKSTDGIMVPREAVVKNGDKDVVWIVAGGVAGKKEVVTGPSDGKSVKIESGLAGSEDIIITGQDALSDGMAVNIREGS